MQRRVVTVAAALLLAVVAGVAGYTLIEGWPIFDSLYMTVITLATIGYGETHPLSNAGRAFTIVLILSGLGIVAYSFTMFTAMIVEGELGRVLRRRKMEKEIAALKDHYIVCGAGPTGRAIVEELHKTGRAFIVIEKDKEKVERFRDRGYLVMESDPTDDESLGAAGVGRAKGVFCSLDADRDNAFVALSARGLNPSLRIVTEQVEEGVREKLLRSGSDIVVNPGFIGGLRMASEMIRPAAVGFMDSMIRGATKETFRIEEVVVPAGSAFVGRGIRELKKEILDDALLLALRQEQGQYEINPSDDLVIAAGTVLVLLMKPLRLAVLHERIKT
ncbi:MAG: NAD-binding protein [Elusimicrobia bacterium]|nr:NAD-binding protein [Elusimicrobiota bacterium]